MFIGYKAGYTETGSNKLYISNDNGQDLITGDFTTPVSASKKGTLTFHALKVMMPDLPTTNPTNPGQLWNEDGVLKISAG